MYMRQSPSREIQNRLLPLPSMINKPNTSEEGNLGRWLLKITLLFGFFFFSGFNSNPWNRLPQVPKTEIVSKTNSVVKRATFFSNTFKSHASDVSVIFPKFDIKGALIAYKLQTKTRFDHICAHLFTFEPHKKFQIRKISPSSEEPHLYLFRG